MIRTTARSILTVSYTHLDVYKRQSLHRESIRAEQIAFGVAPHLNAAGRIEDAKIAVRLMLEKNVSELRKAVEQLILYNQQRKKLQDEAFEQCSLIIEEHLKERKFLVIYAEEIHEGVAGIVAGKLKEQYERPVILVTPSGGHLKGTGRSIKGVHPVSYTHLDVYKRQGLSSDWTGRYSDSH